LPGVVELHRQVLGALAREEPGDAVLDLQVLGPLRLAEAAPAETERASRSQGEGQVGARTDLAFLGQRLAVRADAELHREPGDRVKRLADVRAVLGPVGPEGRGA